MGEALITRRGGGGSDFELERALFTESGSFSATSAGTYRITAIGHGADGGGAYYYDDYVKVWDGCCGGGGYLETKLSEGESITITISDSLSKVTNSAGTTLISATAGTSTGDYYTNRSVSGTVSGIDGVVAFASNNTQTKDIIPPDCYNNSLFISAGGVGGWKDTNNDDNPSQNANSGGAGLFGGPGGDGGAAYYGVSTTYFSFSTSGGSGGLGAGAGGNGAAEASTGTWGALYAYPGAGGGGGFGGGGGKPTAADTGNFYTLFGAGKGAAGCVFIERIK